MKVIVSKPTKEEAEKSGVFSVFKQDGNNRHTPFYCRWTAEEDKLLFEAVEMYGPHKWSLIARHVPGRTPVQCSTRWLGALNPHVHKGRWSKEEDAALTTAVHKYLSKPNATPDSLPWSRVAQCIPNRTGIQCQARWTEALDPTVRKGRWRKEEDEMLRAGVARFGCCWIRVAGSIHGRTQRQCRTRWNQIRSKQEKVAKEENATKKRKNRLLWQPLQQQQQQQQQQQDQQQEPQPQQQQQSRVESPVVSALSPSSPHLTESSHLSTSFSRSSLHMPHQSTIALTIPTNHFMNEPLKLITTTALTTPPPSPDAMSTPNPSTLSTKDYFSSPCSFATPSLHTGDDFSCKSPDSTSPSTIISPSDYFSLYSSSSDAMVIPNLPDDHFDSPVSPLSSFPSLLSHEHASSPSLSSITSSPYAPVHIGLPIPHQTQQPQPDFMCRYDPDLPSLMLPETDFLMLDNLLSPHFLSL